MAQQFTTSHARWTAVQTRNPLAADSFIYSVITTKICCRPTCPSRVPRRANVVFHDTFAAAESDGFRACKRCRPEVRDGGDSESDRQRKTMEKACELIRKERENNEKGVQKWSVKALALEVGLTESHFCRSFKKVVGMTVGEYRNHLLGKLPPMNAVTIPTTTAMKDTAVAIHPRFNDPMDIAMVNDAWTLRRDLDVSDFEYNFDESAPKLDGFVDFFPSEDPFNSNFADIYIPSVAPLHSESESVTPATDPTDDGLQFFDFGLLMENRVQLFENI